MSSDRFRFPTITAVVIANMVGTGVFTSLGFQLLDIESGFAILMLWATGGLIAVCGAMTFAAYATSIANVGSPDWLEKAIAIGLIAVLAVVQAGLAVLFILSSSFESVLLFAGFTLVAARRLSRPLIRSRRVGRSALKTTRAPTRLRPCVTSRRLS